MMMMMRKYAMKRLKKVIHTDIGVFLIVVVGDVVDIGFEFDIVDFAVVVVVIVVVVVVVIVDFVGGNAVIFDKQPRLYISRS
jgi:hypothetical protein